MEIHNYSFHHYCCWLLNMKKWSLLVRRQWTENTWWRHQVETFSALLALCAGISPVTGEFTSQRPVTRSFGVFFDLRLNKRFSEQSGGWWFATLSHPLRRHCNGTVHHYEDKEPLVSYDQHNGCWWFGDARSQGIGSHGDGLLPGIRTRGIDISLIWTNLWRLQSMKQSKKHD